MKILSKHEGWRPSGGSLGFLMLAALLVAVVGPDGRSLRAHEHTRPAYMRSLAAGEARGDAQSGTFASGPADETATCELTLSLIDADTKQPLDGLVRITASDGRVFPLAGLFNRGTGLRRDHAGKEWHVLLESATLKVPQERLTIEAFSGLETELARETIDLAGRAAARVTPALQRFHDAAARGWRSGNTHLHLMSLTRQQADEYLQSISRADGLELVFVSYLRRAGAERNYISNTYTKEQLVGLSGHGVTFGYGEEHRHNFGPGGEGYGHVMFLNIRELIRPVSIGPGIMDEGTDWATVRRGIDSAHRQGATAVWCHNAWGLEDVPDSIAGSLDAHNIFDGGSRGAYRDTFYRFMDVGLRVPFSTGTDWFMYDFSRVYVRVEGPLSVERWLGGLRQGRSFITNGPLLELRVGEHRPGDVIQLEQPETLNVFARAIGRADFGQIELVSGGRIVHSQPSRAVGGHFEAETTIPLQITEPGWIALRVSSKANSELGGPLFGHTSAVYVEVDGKTLFKPQAAEALIADMQQAIRTIDQKATFADETEREDVLSVYRQGIATLRKRLGTMDD